MTDDGNFERYVNTGNGQGPVVTESAYYDYLETRRQTIIMELRTIERILIGAKRLRRESLPTRIK